MEEKILSVLKKYKGSEYNILRVSVMGANNSNQHLVIRIKCNNEIFVVECPYESLFEVKAFLEGEFPTTQIVER
jgi:hypothetical protein